MGTTRPESEPRRRCLVRAATSGALGLALVVGLLLFLSPHAVADGPLPPDPSAAAWLQEVAARVPAVRPARLVPMAGAQSVVTLTVCAGGGCDYASIQDAIDAASPGTDILVAAGTYHEHITMTDGVSVYGQGWDNTIIDGGNAPQAVAFFPWNAGETTVLSGAKIIGGGTGVPNDGGGGVAVYGSPHIVNTFVYSCTGYYGGGVYVSGSGSAPVFDNVRVWNCRALYGGGFYLTGDSSAFIWADPFDVAQGSVLGNTATSQGGGLCVKGASATVAGLHIWANSAPYGGGVWIGDNGQRPVALALNHIWLNSAPGAGGRGGGLRVDVASGANIAGNVFDGNTADYEGGGVSFNQVDGLFWLNLLHVNHAGAGGGAAVAGGCSGLTIEGNRFEANTAGQGGGLRAYAEATTVDANTFVSNTANIGGAIHLSDVGALTLTNNILAHNVASGAAVAGGLYIGQSPARVINNTIADNTGDGIYFSDAENVKIVNNIVSGNSGHGLEANTLDGWQTSVYLADYNDFHLNGDGAWGPGASPGAHDMQVNPTYVGSGDAAAFYHIQASSPVWAAGSTSWAPKHDIDGERRGTRGTVSIGADEILPPVYLPLVRRP